MRDPDTAEALRVVLVDGDDRARMKLARCLRARGHRVTEAATAADATSALCLEVIDTLLLDATINEDTAWDVLWWLRSEERDRPNMERPRVVVLTATPSPSTRRLDQFEPDIIVSGSFPVDELARFVERDAHSSGDERLPEHDLVKHEPLTLVNAGYQAEQQRQWEATNVAVAGRLVSDPAYGVTRVLVCGSRGTVTVLGHETQDRTTAIDCSNLCVASRPAILTRLRESLVAALHRSGRSARTHVRL